VKGTVVIHCVYNCNYLKALLMFEELSPT